jgi:hypothetical protein
LCALILLAAALLGKGLALCSVQLPARRSSCINYMQRVCYRCHRMHVNLQLVKDVNGDTWMEHHHQNLLLLLLLCCC